MWMRNRHGGEMWREQDGRGGRDGLVFEVGAWQAEE